jgi:hypothetical protein
LAKTAIVAENQGRAIVRSDGAASWKVASTSDGVIYVNVSGGEFLQPENVAAAKQEDGSTVFIKLLRYLERGVGLASGSLDADTFRAIYLLHELGHILGGYANDKGDSNTSIGFTKKVIDDCFSIPR